MVRTPADEELMLRAAELYYYEERTQADVAEKLGLTRWTVGRLLDDARKTGLVRIVIDHPLGRRHDLEVELTRAFGLREVVVLPSQSRTAITATAVARVAAQRLAAIRPTVRRIAVSWGRTIAAVAADLPRGWAKGVEVVQTNGGPTLAAGNPVGDSLHVMAEKGPGSVRSLTVPTIVGSAELAASLRREVSIGQTLAAAAAAKVMIYSPGSVSAESVLVRSGYLTADQVASWQRAGAVGDILSHFITGSGAVADPGLDARTLSIDLAAVRRCPTVIAVAWGAHKTEATRAAMTAGLCTTAIVDSAIATALLDPHQTWSSGQNEER